MTKPKTIEVPEELVRDAVTACKDGEDMTDECYNATRSYIASVRHRLESLLANQKEGEGKKAE